MNCSLKNLLFFGVPKNSNTKQSQMLIKIIESGGKNVSSILQRGGADPALVHLLTILTLAAAGTISMATVYYLADYFGYFAAGASARMMAEQAVQGCGELSTGNKRGIAQEFLDWAAPNNDLPNIDCEAAWSNVKKTRLALRDVVYRLLERVGFGTVALTVGGYWNLYNRINDIVDNWKWCGTSNSGNNYKYPKPPPGGPGAPIQQSMDRYLVSNNKKRQGGRKKTRKHRRRHKKRTHKRKRRCCTRKRRKHRKPRKRRKKRHSRTRRRR